MPAVSEKQKGFMRLCSTPDGRKKAGKDCPPIKVAKEFVHESKGKKLKRKMTT